MTNLVATPVDQRSNSDFVRRALETHATLCERRSCQSLFRVRPLYPGTTRRFKTAMATSGCFEVLSSLFRLDLICLPVALRCGIPFVSLGDMAMTSASPCPRHCHTSRKTIHRHDPCALVVVGAEAGPSIPKTPATPKSEYWKQSANPRYHNELFEVPCVVEPRCQID